MARGRPRKLRKLYELPKTVLPQRKRIRGKTYSLFRVYDEREDAEHVAKVLKRQTGASTTVVKGPTAYGVYHRRRRDKTVSTLS